MNDDYLSKLHTEILDIMDVIDQICKDYQLHYYLTGGTLLGAVRHGGFIPWDDDLDIVMPRDDFDKFIELCPTMLPVGYSLRWISTDEKYFRLFAKVCKDGTKFIESKEMNSYSAFGIFVDIFPIDESINYNRNVEQRKFIIEKIKVMLSGKRWPNSFKFPKNIIINILSYRFLHFIAKKVMTKSNGKGYHYYTNYGSQYTAKQRTVPKEWLGEGRQIQFENRKYIVANKYELVLENIFGSNYMQLPKPEKRKTHYPLEVVFSDGTEMKFEEVKHRMTIKESLE